MVFNCLLLRLFSFPYAFEEEYSFFAAIIHHHMGTIHDNGMVILLHKIQSENIAVRDNLAHLDISKQDFSISFSSQITLCVVVNSKDDFDVFDNLICGGVWGHIERFNSSGIFHLHHRTSIWWVVELERLSIFTSVLNQNSRWLWSLGFV